MRPSDTLTHTEYTADKRYQDQQCYDYDWITIGKEKKILYLHIKRTHNVSFIILSF